MRLTALTGACVVLVYCTLLPQEIESKVFTPCEVGSFLSKQPGILKKDIPTWLCLADRESDFNSNAILNNPGGHSVHGMYQINDKFWCSVGGRPGGGCNAKCSSFHDNNLADDIGCAAKIKADTEKFRSNGFKAWETYQFCNTPEKVAPYVDFTKKGCVNHSVPRPKKPKHH